MSERSRPLFLTIECVLAAVLFSTVAAWAAEEAAPAPQRAEIAMPAPQIDLVRPNTGPITGGREIKIEGRNFDDFHEGVVVKFGGVPSSRVIVDTPESLRALLPATKKGGVVDVEVINPDGNRGVATAEFCYAKGNKLMVLWYAAKLRMALAWRLALLGGWIVAVLVAISVGGLAWCIHLLLALRQRELMPPEFIDEVASRIQRGELESAARLCEREDYVFARIIGAGLAKAIGFPHQVREAIEASGSREAAHLSQKISYVSNIGVIAPMLGLLGTVIGMIRVFEAIAEQGSRSVYLAAAVYQAVITTCVGLMVGIPAMILYFYFRGRVLRLVMIMEESAERIAEAIDASKAGEPQ